MSFFLKDWINYHPENMAYDVMAQNIYVKMTCCALLNVHEQFVLYFRHPKTAYWLPILTSINHCLSKQILWDFKFSITAALVLEILEICH